MKLSAGDEVHLVGHPHLTGALLSREPYNGVGDCTIKWAHSDSPAGYILSLLVLINSPSDNIPEEW